RGAPAPGTRDFVGVADMQFQYLAIAGQRLRQVDAHAGVVDQVVRRLPAAVRLDLDRGDLETFGGAVAPPRPRHRRARTGAVDVLVQLQPQYVQRVGAVVGVGDRLLALQPVRGRIDRRVQVVVGAILPVRRPR